MRTRGSESLPIEWPYTVKQIETIRSVSPLPPEYHVVFVESSPGVRDYWCGPLGAEGRIIPKIKYESISTGLLFKAVLEILLDVEIDGHVRPESGAMYPAQIVRQEMK